MGERHVRQIELDELKNIYNSIKEDFSFGEYAPYEVLYQQLQKGTQEGFIFSEEQYDLGYSTCTAENTNGFVLISLLAVFEKFRRQGIGTEFLKALCKRYEQKQGVLVEVERPDLSQTDEEHEIRSRRIGFYEKAGFYVIPGIDYVIWDVPMYLMVLPLKASKEAINRNIKQIMYDIYLPMIGERFISKLKFID